MDDERAHRSTLARAAHLLEGLFDAPPRFCVLCIALRFQARSLLCGFGDSTGPESVE
jgi:hypothetical protein